MIVAVPMALLGWGLNKAIWDGEAFDVVMSSIGASFGCVDQWTLVVFAAIGDWLRRREVMVWAGLAGPNKTSPGHFAAL